MGHWEQTGRDNAEERARRAALPRWRRGVTFYGVVAFLSMMWIAAILGIMRLFGAL